MLGQSIMERLVTPGPLSNAHARLESNCNGCHSAFRKEAQNSKCSACHKGIAGDIAGGTRFHGKFGPARSGNCKSCHSEHKGRNVRLIGLNASTFNHNFSAFPLTGKHAKVACTTCHRQAPHYRGAPHDCASCHAAKDPHRGQLGRACANCHSTSGWKPVQGFDHARTGFALTGAHRSQTCASCHAGQRWKGIGKTCASCHAKDDAHRGSRGTNCASCHTTATWRSATFDHSSTGFPLIGGHAQASCASCHGAGNANKHPSRSCFSCHARDDTHKGQNGTDCASCHNPRSWKQTSFDHDRMTRFALKGPHRTAACAACHIQPAKVAKPPVTCFGCHAKDDTHKGANGMDCARCHTVTTWKTSNFNHNTMTDFPLAGAHATAKCEACHTQGASKAQLSTQCGSCHAKDDVHSGKLGQNCARCHSSSAWTGKVRFEHDLTRFPLLGKHAALQCASCHADRTFSAKGAACQDCHADKHHAGALGTPAQCRNCHTTSDWKVWKFDHDSQTQFALTGKHRGLICSACHSRPGDPSKVGTRCIDCHRRSDPHRGGFGEDCERCHVTSGFGQIIMGNNGKN
ncbi:cytochrome C [Novosphingobium sp.]|uniref:cytochrome C n=1 Tax=Novosphingobium sp. TaxID=1874826 RepID=UPI00286E5AE7|nr:cytochrome C [Novosphingobium sp.]